MTRWLVMTVSISVLVLIGVRAARVMTWWLAGRAMTALRVRRVTIGCAATGAMTVWSVGAAMTVCLARPVMTSFWVGLATI